MFCAKCGTKLNEDDRFCPQCGAQNENYSEGKSKAGLFFRQPEKTKAFHREESSGENEKDKKGRKIKIPIIIGCCFVVIAVFCLCGKLILKENHHSASRITYSPRGISGYEGVNGNEYFIQNGQVVTFEGKANCGRTTPDYSKYIVLWEDETLMWYTGADDKGKKIADGVSKLSAVNNYGCFYETAGKSQLYFYDFKSEESTDTGFENYSLTFSQGNISVAGLDEKGELFVFSYGDTASKRLCNVGSDAEVCCVVDDGSNVIWYNDIDNTFCIYMMENGVPERIGKIKKASKYSVVIGDFFDNGKSFIIASAKSPQILLSVNGGEVQEITLPGVKGYGVFLDYNGKYVDSDDDSMSEFYFGVLDNKDETDLSLYRMNTDGELKSIVSDMGTSGLWYLNFSDYHIVDGKVFYINNERDFLQADLENDKEMVKITTEVSNVYISSDNKYAYIVKSGSLYYWKLSDSSYKLNLITNNFTQYDTLEITDQGDTIYYINETEDIKDSYQDKGVLYRFVIGSEPEKIAEDVMYIRSNDSENVSAGNPIFIQYVSNEESDFVVNVGTIAEDKFKVLIENVIY